MGLPQLHIGQPILRAHLLGWARLLANHSIGNFCPVFRPNHEPLALLERPPAFSSKKDDPVTVVARLEKSCIESSEYTGRH
jgi:hypothetical protein